VEQQNVRRSASVEASLFPLFTSARYLRYLRLSRTSVSELQNITNVRGGGIGALLFLWFIEIEKQNGWRIRKAMADGRWQMAARLQHDAHLFLARWPVICNRMRNLIAGIRK
jgi:hypothetical protein